MDKRLLKPFLLGLRTIILETVGLLAFPRFFKRLNPDSISSILVVADCQVGDTVLAMPMIDALSARWPSADIVIMANSNGADLWRMHPAITDVVTISKSALTVRKVASVRKLLKWRFDLAIDATCDRTLLGAALTMLSRSRYRLGYDIAGRGFLFNRPVFRRARAPHIVDELVSLAAAAGAPAITHLPRVVIPGPLTDRAEKILALDPADGFLIGVHSGGTYPTQRWMPERFAQVAQRLTERHHSRIVFFGRGAAEEADYRRVAKGMTRQPIMFVNQPLGLTAAAVGLCRMVLCNNSGILHIAAALDIPTVSTMGPTVAHRFKPVGRNQIVLRKNIPCIGCNSGTCLIGTHDCMKLISVDEMVEAAEKILSS